MEEKLSIKENAVELLEKQLATKAKKDQHGFVAMFLNFNSRFTSLPNLIWWIERDFDLLKQIDGQPPM
jgi:hypothetical protein